jgi:hypothetical protein
MSRLSCALVAVGVVASLSCGEGGVGTSFSVTSVNPLTGPTTGGTVVTVKGTGFPSNIASVTFGGTPGTNITVTGDTSASVTTPAHDAGPVTVTVTLANGLSASVNNAFTFIDVANPTPTLASIAPTSGPIAGGTAFTLTGTGFLTGASVTLGGTAATAVSVASATSITGTTPAHAAGAVDVIVMNSDNKGDTLVGAFTFTAPAPAAPTISVIAPTSGSVNGGTSFTITGTNFVAGATVSFGGTAATGVNVASATSITGTTPARAAGAVNVVVTNPDAQSATLTNGFTFVAAGGAAPTITNLSRTAGSAGGGATVVITGTNYAAGTSVSFGGSVSSSVTVNSATQLTVVVPAHAVGVVAVDVTSNGETTTLPAAFEYLPAPTTTYFENTFEGNTLSPLQADVSPGGSVTVSTEQAFAGIRSAKTSANAGNGIAAGLIFTFGGATPANAPASEPNGLYLRWYMHVPTATVDLLQATAPFSAQMKVHLFRLITGSGQPGWVMCGVGSDFPPGRNLTCFFDNGVVTIPGGATSHQPGDGKWVEIQLWYKRVGGQGRSRMWVDGKQVFDATSALQGNDDVAAVFRAYFGGLYNESPNGTVSAFVDNVKAANGFIDP